MKELILHDEGDGITSFDRPFMVCISNYGLYQLQSLNPRFTPRLLGYREVRRNFPLHTSDFARPWALWAVLRMAEKTKQGYRSLLYRLGQKWGSYRSRNR